VQIPDHRVIEIVGLEPLALRHCGDGRERGLRSRDIRDRDRPVQCHDRRCLDLEKGAANEEFGSPGRMSGHRPGMLIDTVELRQHVEDPQWIVFDCRHDLFDLAKGPAAYDAGHIPGAHFAPVDTALSGVKTGTNGRHPLPTAADFAGFLNRHGVTAETPIVAYDDVGGQYAARLWWLARWIGLTQVAVLDGGYPKWVADGHPVSTGHLEPRGGGNIIPAPDDSQWVKASFVLEGLNAGKSLVVDARASERFGGDVEPIDRVAGHIPGARNRFFKVNLNPDLTLRPASELQREFNELLGGRCPANVVHYCGSGITACANLLAMEHAGLSGSKLYAGSWSEWIADPARPIDRG